MWKIEDNLFEFVKNCTKLLSSDPLFFLINSYTTGLQPAVLKNILTLTLKDFEGETCAYEVGLPTDDGIALPCGASGMFVGKDFSGR
jgi:23S rRNA (cytosine1962-C5)-methyltransferase